MPPGLDYPGSIDLWRPIAEDPATAGRRNMSLQVLARLRPGQTLMQAQSDMERVSSELANDYPAANNGWVARVVSLHDHTVGNVRTPLLVLFAAVGIVLFIACANVANMLLAHALSRRKEIAIRMGLGAGRRRLVRQLMTESLLVAALGGIGGLILSIFSADLLLTISPQRLPQMNAFAFDANVAGFTSVLVIVTGILFGIAPALQSSRLDLQNALKEAGRSSTDGGRHRLRAALVIGETALALVLLVAAGLLTKTLFNLYSVNPGFRSEDLLTLRVSLPEAAYPGPRETNNAHQRLLSNLGSVAGVQSIAATNSLPISGDNPFVAFTRSGEEFFSATGDFKRVYFRRVSANYHELMGIPLMRGRYLTDADNADSPAVVLINETMARTHWPGEEAVGQTMTLTFGPPVRRTIVGVVADIKHSNVIAPPLPEVFTPYLQDPFPVRTMALLLRTPLSAASITAAIRDRLRAIDPELAAYRIETMDQLIERSTAQPRFLVVLLVTFAGVALLLTVIGLYGVISYAVGQRTREIGIRIALGANPGEIRTAVVRNGLMLALAGTGLGLAASLGLSRLLASLLYEVTTFDPMIYSATSLLLIVVAILASWIPARRAMMVDPMVTLRED
jgi:putative ABC transport system permease protein